MSPDVVFEVELEDGKPPQTFHLRLDINALIAAQTAVGIKDDLEFFTILGTRLSLSMPILRTLVYHGLRKTEKSITLERAGDIITAYGSHRMVHMIDEALRWALPEPKKKELPKEGEAGPETEAPPSDGLTS